MEPGKTIVGFIGLGVMGQSMALHILNAGYKLHVFTRTKKKAQHIISKGAVWEDTVSDLSAKCDVIITIVGFPDDVEEVYMGNKGILNHAKKDTIMVDMTTSSPDQAVKIDEKAKEKGLNFLDAPVSGGDLGAKNATLSIMVGGEKRTFDKVMPIFEVLVKNIVLQGKAGAGQHTKMANQIAIASGMVAVCEALAYAKKSGLDPEAVLKCIGPGAAGSWSLNNLGPRMLAGNFEPGFYIRHFLKDMKIAAASSSDLGLKTPGLDLALSLYKKMEEKGLENKGTQALYKLYL